MNDQQLYSLLTAVEYGSFSKAADILFLSKQALKKQIDTLEDELGFTLINRNRKGIALTPAGEEFCSGVKIYLAQLEAVTQKAKAIAWGKQTIRIENPYHPRLLLEHAFDEFSRRFPTIRMHITLQHSAHNVEDILNDRVDIAECTYSPRYEVPGIACTKLFPLPYRCLMSSSNPLASRDEIVPEELTGCQVYIPQYDARLIDMLRNNYPQLRINFLMQHNLDQLPNICYNQGIFISKAYYLTYMQPLVTVPLRTVDNPMAAIIYRENPNELVREFIKIAEEVYAREAKTPSLPDTP